MSDSETKMIATAISCLILAALYLAVSVFGLFPAWLSFMFGYGFGFVTGMSFAGLLVIYARKTLGARKDQNP